MAGPWGGGSGSSGGPWGGATTRSQSLPKPKKKKKGRSFGGFIGNLAGEVGSLAGVPMGLVSLGKSAYNDPIATTKMLGVAAWNSHIANEFKQAAKGPTPIWSKGAREDFQYMYEHPLQSVLDVTFVGSAAVSASARAARVAAPASKLAQASKPRPVVLKDPTSKGRPDVELATRRGGYVNPFTQGRKHLTASLMPEKMMARRYERHRKIRDRRDLTTVENYWTAAFAAAKAITERGPVRQAKQAAIVKDMHRIYSGIGQEFDVKPKDYAWIRRPDGPHMAIAREGYSYVEQKPGVFREVKGTKGQKKIRSGEGFVFRKTGAKTMRKEPGVGLESDYTPAAFEASLMGGRIREMFTTKDPAQALRGPNGKPLAAPQRVIDSYIDEAAGSHRSLVDLVEKTTRPWRAAVLGTPRYAMNNVIGGTSIMLLNNPTGFKYYIKAAANVLGKNKASKIMQHNPGKGVSWVDEVFGHMRSHGFVQEVPRFNVKGKLGKAVNVERSWYDFVNRWSEEAYRVSALMQRVRKDPEITQMRKQGLSEHEAVLAKARADRQWVHQVSDDIDDIFGQYHYHNDLERTVRSAGVPFYGWYRAISRSTTNTFKDRPGRALGLMALGESGIEETEEALGEIPHFMRSVIPLGGFLKGSPGPGRRSILTTQGMNPWNTPAEFVRGLGAAGGSGEGRVSETLGGMFGPIPATAIEALTGRDLLTDVPHRKNLGALAAENFGLNPERGGLPQLQTFMALRQEDQPGTYRTKSGRKGERLYDPDRFNTLLGLSGFPRKYVSTAQAKKRKRQEDAY